MIKINLLKRRKNRGSLGVDFSKINVKLLIIAFVLFFAIEYLAVNHFKGVEAEIDRQIVEISTKNQALDEQIKENEKVKIQVENYKAQIVVLEERSKLVDSIVQQRKNPKDLLERLARDVTSQLWFTLLRIDNPVPQDGAQTRTPTSASTLIEIKGNARSFTSIGDFITKANGSRFFGSTLQLKDSQTVTSGDDSSRRVEAFTIEGKVAAY